jgi:hypothetical protein
VNGKRLAILQICAQDMCQRIRTGFQSKNADFP